ncbi:MAG: C cytochrome precursor [Verrucomicrobiales bacterium]|nr:C cytochrome precursor [Verrucomicrobiales bacterium]|tara:strand:- start:7432 stop:9336 length:1905 start_codon:yes stop_codon:yes gene_type:complete
MRIEDNIKPPSKIRIVVIAVVVVSLIGMGILSFVDLRPEWSLNRTDAELMTMRPKVEPFESYVGSETCKECHKQQHTSWYNSWHRTMTQEADLDKIIGDFNDVTHTNEHGQALHLFKRDGKAWYRTNYDPLFYGITNDTRREFPIELMTGSHHMQVYWHPTGRARTLALMPILYLKDDRRWIPRSSAFLQPPDSGHFEHELMRWNFTCLRCHTTNPDPGHLTNAPAYSFDTQVAELGISCEACHGPGGPHLNYHASKTKTGSDPIVNPSELSNDLSAQVCGSCHSISLPKTLETHWRAHKPGDALVANRNIERGKREAMDKLIGANESLTDYSQIYDYDNQFWLDGAVRVSGREYNGFLETACHTRGEMACTSCHSLHQSTSDKRDPKEWANDQLHPDRMGDKGCTQCHDSGEYATPKHTHHLPNSSGSSCYNCHMPHTTYGLLKAIRSHTIKSPTVKDTLDARRPTACNLCHLDKTLEWTATHLNDWYGHEVPELSQDEKQVSSAVLMALTGDAGLRALLAWHMSWEPAVKVSKGDGWLQAYLTILLKDPYDAVRYIASRSLKTYDSHKNLNYDFIDNPQSRTEAAHEALQLWRHSKVSSGNPHILIDDKGFLMRRLGELYELRNERDVRLLE